MTMHTYEDDVKLIKCVQQHPVLWQKAYENGRGRLTTRIWQDIRDLFFPNKTVTETKMRWKVLRDHYRRELRRIEACEQYVSSWKLFNHLKFLDGHFRLRRNPARKIKEMGTSSEMTQTEVPNICWSGQTEASYVTSSWQDCESMRNSREVFFNYRFRSQNKKKPNLEPGELTWVNSVSNRTFVASVIPLIEQLSPQQNVQARIHIMNIIRRALRDEA